MGTRKFRVTFEGEAVIELDDAVIGAYVLFSPKDIAEHIAYNLVINHARLSMLDGWADLPDDNARVVGDPDWEIFAEEKPV